MAAVSRKQFLRGRLSDCSSSPVRPPWALAELDFLEHCSRCDDCRKACTQHIIEQGMGGFPEINFRRADCSFCGACVLACNSGALVREQFEQRETPWRLMPRVAPSCLMAQTVYCRSCVDHCDTGALRMRPKLGGLGELQIDADHCNGCGACVAPCPVGALALTQAETENLSRTKAPAPVLAHAA